MAAMLLAAMTLAAAPAAHRRKHHKFVDLLSASKAMSLLKAMACWVARCVVQFLFVDTAVQSLF